MPSKSTDRDGRTWVENNGNTGGYREVKPEPLVSGAPGKGAIAGAVTGGVIAGPVGAVAGAAIGWGLGIAKKVFFD